MRGRAFAKVNLGLRVKPMRSDGYHPIVSLAQSIDWADRLDLDVADEDHFEASGAPVPDGADNLAWQAMTALRGGPPPVLHMRLEKHIAVAAGLGGGSADAALALVLTAAILDKDAAQAVSAAAGVGADVPFCLAGGTAWLEGIGERITRVVWDLDYWLAVVVPPFEVATPAVYRRWDELGGPTGPPLDGRELPVSLRDQGPLANDLQPAALDLVPELGDWIADVASSWGQRVLMSGSGPSLFGFFASESEAADAVAAVPGTRAGRAVRPIDRGWEADLPETLPPAPWGVG